MAKEKKTAQHAHEHDHAHTHTQEGGVTHTHAHTHGHGAAHTHTHPHENTKKVINRLSRAEGHLRKVKSMVESGVDCSEVLIQLSAVIAALNSTGRVILEDHIDHCIVDAVRSGDQQSIEDLKKALDRFMK